MLKMSCKTLRIILSIKIASLYLIGMSPQHEAVNDQAEAGRFIELVFGVGSVEPSKRMPPADEQEIIGWRVNIKSRPCNQTTRASEN